ncbi:P63C domain-containing protein [[Clostridium] scindens]|jgi:hypothetical protein|uniref:P63C domain-containing protein n=1 Tax=Clostridium scindens (strain JCM 10418 / VPI 12708) TaxID=29347 RepID=UPI002E769F52|nr:P63C domain-containing protein [[Clostridium] scindens]MEE0649138.1 P63C domain-containing protein [[Clostridium] scindens]
MKEDITVTALESPFAKYSGSLSLGDKPVDCYVLDDKNRVISMRATVKAIANDDNGDLLKYVGVKSLQPYIDSAGISSRFVEFTIPGNPNKAKGITAETFLDICSAYVSALTSGAPLTEKQRGIAINCSILLSACAKTGLIALIDEATGYQYEREEDALQVKIRAFISEELRAWEKTFPDELWEEFGRLTHWQGSLQQRPKYWGKLVLELIYDAMDPDVAKYLKENKPKPRHGLNYHQWLSEDLGVKALTTHLNQVIGIAKTCNTMEELRHKVALYYGKEDLQLSMGDVVP